MATRYNGKDLSLMFGTQEVNADGTQVVLDNEESDDDAVTFAEVGTGAGRQWFFTITALTDMAVGTFWDFCWENAGSSVSFEFKPYGNATASTDQPHFTGNATVVRKPPIDVSAGETSTFEIRLDVEGEPTKVTA